MKYHSKLLQVYSNFEKMDEIQILQTDQNFLI